MSTADKGMLDPSIVAALYVEHGEELRRFLLGILRDGQLTADVLQATFVKMAERGHETQEESRKAWRLRVAYHEAMACLEAGRPREAPARAASLDRARALFEPLGCAGRVRLVEAVRRA